MVDSKCILKWDKIKKRTQEEASIGICLAIKNNLFKWLRTPVDESVKLKVIRNNIPFRQTHID